MDIVDKNISKMTFEEKEDFIQEIELRKDYSEEISQMEIDMYEKLIKDKALENKNDNIKKSSKSLLSSSAYYKQKNDKRILEIEKNCPEEMKNLPNWCVYKTYYNRDDNKKRKVILSPITKHWARCNVPSDWTNFDEAIKFAKENNAEGLSFALTRESKIICVDLDHCINNGMRTEFAWKLLNKSNETYCEKSVSGTGLHIFFKGNIEEHYNKHVSEKGLECYCDSKFISITGNIISKTNYIKESKQLENVLKENLGKKNVFKSENIYQYKNVSLSNSELIEKIRKSKVADTFDRLMKGEDICGDHSKSDAKLMNILAYFSNCNVSQMQNIFEQSGLYRPEKKEAYIKRTIDFVCKTISSTSNNLLTKRNNNANNTRSNSK